MITPTTLHDVEQAIASKDTGLLERHGRLLGPITDRILTRDAKAAHQDRIRELTTTAFERYLQRSRICE